MQTITGQLKYGLSLNGETHKDFELREATAADLFAAEDEVSTDSPLKFNAALLCRQITRLGTFDAPITVSLLGKLKVTDFNILRTKQLELEKLGEAGAGGTE